MSLAAEGLINDGYVNTKSIKDLSPEEVTATQCHFFAGIGVWSYALRLAGWPDDLPVWTGSCPCQPFSAAGRRGGVADDRHLWPDWFRLIEQCRPPVVFGEQVASPDGLKWFDAVSSDLEGAGYSVGAADLCSAGVGAPHIRQRLHFVAISSDQRRKGQRVHLQPGRSQPTGTEVVRRGAPSLVGDGSGPRLERHAGNERGGAGRSHPTRPVAEASPVGVLVNPGGARGRGNPGAVPCPEGESQGEGREARYLAHELVTPGATRGFWEAADWVLCRDGKARPVEPGTFPLADGPANRVGQLRAYGNAVNAELTATFIRAAVEAM
jgi:DNA (cytosine-5)-methyltransferase 1